MRVIEPPLHTPCHTNQFNLTDKDNPQLLHRVLTGQITIPALCRMTPEQLASTEAQEKSTRLARKSLLVRGMCAYAGICMGVGGLVR